MPEEVLNGSSIQKNAENESQHDAPRELDYTIFEESRKVLALRVRNKDVQRVKTSAEVEPFLDKATRYVVPDPDEPWAYRRLLLKNGCNSVPDSLQSYIDARNKEGGEEAGVVSIAVVEHESRTTYKDLAYYDALRKIIPADLEVPQSYERIGHIAHLNLRDESREYRFLIAQIVLDKNPGLKTVVNKRSTITSEYRTPDLELLAGEADYVASLIENGIKYKIDYQNVYWNSRLCGERETLSRMIPTSCLVLDVMGGVGAFAMPLARKDCYVLCNDLNPSAAKYARINAQDNDLAHNVYCINLDGREFLRKCIAAEGLNVLNRRTLTLTELADVFPAQEPQGATEESTKKRRKITAKSAQEAAISNSSLKCAEVHYKEVHIIMNLPEIAMEFLDVFKRSKCATCTLRSVMHCYCFCDSKNYTADIQSRLAEHLGMVPRDLSIREVRSVAPEKVMYCIEFPINSEVLSGKLDAAGSSNI